MKTQIQRKIVNNLLLQNILQKSKRKRKRAELNVVKQIDLKQILPVTVCAPVCSLFNYFWFSNLFCSASKEAFTHKTIHTVIIIIDALIEPFNFILIRTLFPFKSFRVCDCLFVWCCNWIALFCYFDISIAFSMYL